MTISFNKKQEGFYFIVIGILSIAIPFSMSIVLFTAPIFEGNQNVIQHFPTFKAVLNALILVLLITGTILIKLQKTLWHRRTMLSCLFLTVIFFVSYITYYLYQDLSFFADENGDRVISAIEKAKVSNFRILHFVLFVTHILSGVFLVPLILLSYYFTLSGQIGRHKKSIRWTVPLWLYVTISYLVLYWMMNPYLLSK